MIDLRSDTVTRPTDPMRQAMAAAEVGDDVYGEDPTVNALERAAAERVGKEAALFVPSGTQANLLALLTHCGRGDAYVVGEDYHSFSHEGGGAAVLGGIQPLTVAVEADGRIAPQTVRGAITPDDDPHCARTKVIALENPTWGKVLPVDYLEAIAQLAEERGLALHLDGARLFNAACALDLPAARVAAPLDSVMFSLSKGLGCPVGALLCGAEDFIAEARRWRKVVGGGWRQAGILAAAGLHALDHHVDRLADDHQNARRLADKLDAIDGIDPTLDKVDTNMVYADLQRGDVDDLADFLADRDIRVHPRSPMRLVTHLDVSLKEVDRAADTIAAYLAGVPAKT